MRFVVPFALSEGIVWRFVNVSDDDMGGET